MALKSSKSCCAFTWIPDAEGICPLLATASYAGFVGKDFSSESFLDILRVDVLQTDELNMESGCRVRLPAQACRLDWSPLHGKKGVIAVGCANGLVYVYDVENLLTSSGQSSSALQCTIDAGTDKGAVKGCHFNARQLVLATGYDKGEWHIWSLQQISAPVLLKVDPHGNTTSVSSVSQLLWHPNFYQILCIAGGDNVTLWNTESRTTVKTIDTRALHAVCVAWNPVEGGDAAGQLAIGGNREPAIIQLWNMNEFAPRRELSGHNHKGITALAWCKAGSTSILASCDNGGDILLWDVRNGSVVGRLELTCNIVELQWCPSLPLVLATSSSEPRLAVLSVEDAIEDDGFYTAVQAKALQMPCRGSMNMFRHIAYLQPHSIADIQIADTSAVLLSSQEEIKDVVRDGLRGLPESFLKTPQQSPERAQWLQQHGHGLLCALEFSKTNRQPLVDYLRSTTEQERRHEPDDETLTPENKSQSYSRMAELVASKQIPEAVEMCIESKNFEDAYALAALCGGELLQKVHHQHLECVSRECKERHHIRFAHAIATGNFTALVESDDLPWKEVLLAITLYVGDAYTELCNVLGRKLAEKQNVEGALMCFSCCCNIDGCIDLWRNRGMSRSEIVHHTVLLEEVTGRRSKSAYYSDCLYDCGQRLVSAGHLQMATEYLRRSAEIGHPGALVLLDRLLPGQIKAAAVMPTPETKLPDRPSPECMQMLHADVAPSQPQQAQQPLPAVVQQNPGFYPPPTPAAAGPSSMSQSFGGPPSNPPGLPAAPGGTRLSASVPRIQPTPISAYSSSSTRASSVPQAMPQPGYPMSAPSTAVAPPPRPGQGMFGQQQQQQQQQQAMPQPGYPMSAPSTAVAPPPRPGQGMFGQQQQQQQQQQAMPQPGYPMPAPGTAVAPPPRPGHGLFGQHSSAPQSSFPNASWTA